MAVAAASTVCAAAVAVGTVAAAVAVAGTADVAVVVAGTAADPPHRQQWRVVRQTGQQVVQIV